MDVLSSVLVGRLGRHATLPSLFKCFTTKEKAMAIQALMLEPEVILADEPVASLDPRNAEKVMKSLAHINARFGITVICNLNHLDTARQYCDRIIGMSHGRRWNWPGSGLPLSPGCGC